MVVVDIETTGLNPLESSIIEIGAVDFYNSDNKFNQRCKIRDDSFVNPMSLKVNGYTINDLRNSGFRSEKELLINFISWLKNIDKRTIAGQNVNFDLRFLNTTKDRENVEWDFGRRVVDIHSIAYAHMESRGLNPPLKIGTSRLNGDYIMKYVGIPLEPKPHKGINGAIYETEALYRLMFNRNCFDEFKQYKLNF
ncbi:3'-5' exonuclease [uncultured Aquimarina sp.]|uniref:3'-5' exonuclease n=1 Tax=uncultured Aquimarina sp. TaxID=575652 RepID=UPI002612A4C6|nr:3'-5' exonuclease [uncultured Aquimarina sp.]